MKFLTRIMLISILGLGFAQAAAPAKSTEIKNVSGTVKWTGYGVGKSHTGTVAIKSGEITLEGDKPQQAHFILDMKSLDTADSEKLKGHLKSPDFFDVEKYPEAHFKSTSIKAVAFVKAAEPMYAVKGDLTVKDKTAPIEFQMTITNAKGTYTGKATTEIPDRTKFGIVYNSKQYSTVSKLGDKLIQDNIKVDIDVTAK